MTSTRPLAARTFAQHFGDLRLRRAFAIAQDVGRIADQRAHALVADLFQPRDVGRPAEARRRIELPVAGVDDDARLGADGEQIDFGDRMRHRHEFDLERAERQPRSLRDDVNRHLWSAGLGEAARGEQARGETRRIDRAAQPGPQRRDGADVILVGVGDDQSEQIGACFSMKDRSGRIRSTPGISDPAKATPQSTRIHLRFFAGPNP